MDTQTREFDAPTERLLLLILATIQFITILDFLIMMPLGPQYMRVFSITPGQFGWMVSAYEISAGVAGIGASFVLDRFERRKALLTLYTGFGIGTLFCALAPTFETLTAARALAGAFGGVTGALILALVGDIFPEERRGRAMGIIMSAFSLASILGVPIGLWLANHFGWQAPFYLLAFTTIPILIGAARLLPPIRAHGFAVNPPLQQAREIMLPANHQRAFLFIGLVTFAGFLIIPYISAYMVANVGFRETELPYIYMIGGLFTIVSMNLVGRAADRWGKLRVFTIAAFSAAAATMILTALPRVGMALGLVVTTLFMVCMSSRMVPAMSMMTSTVQRRYRAGFMSVTAAVLHFASGLASFVGGLFLGQNASGAITRYWVAGIASVVVMFVSIAVAQKLRPAELPAV